MNYADRLTILELVYPVCAACPYHPLSSLVISLVLELAFCHDIVTLICVDSSLNYPIREEGERAYNTT